MMNRRTALGRIILTAIGGGFIFGGYKWYDWHKLPDSAWLIQHKPLLASLADTIIPPTDTPGAGEAKVEEYIIAMIRDCIDRKTGNKFVDGLKELEHYCHSEYSKPFEQLSLADKNKVLDHFEKKARPFNALVGKAESLYLGSPFFATLKKLTVEGYCTSELGATKGLSYLYIPGHFQGCIPLQPGQKSWATR